MSRWWDVEDKESLSTSEDKKEVHICFDDDYSGAMYVSVPTEVLVEFLRKAGVLESEDTKK